MTATSEASVAATSWTDDSIGGGVPVAIVGGEGYRWDAASESWTLLPLPAAGPWQLLATDGSSYLASSDEGLVQSPDGDTWSPAPLEETWGFFALAIDGDVRLASNFFTFARSTDGGVTWTTDAQASQLVGRPSELLVDGKEVLAAGNDGIFASHDSGVSWSPIPGTTGYASMGLGRQGTRSFVSAGLMQTSSDGQSWSVVDGLSSRHIESLFSLKGGFAATTPDGWTHRLEDGGWTRLDDLGRIVATADHADASYAIVRGIYFTDLIRSFDGGASWSTMPPVGGTLTARMGSMVAVQGVLLVGSTTTLSGGSKTGSTLPGIGIQRSHDGGFSWQSGNGGLPMLGYLDADTTMHPVVVELFAIDEVAFAVVEDAGLFRSDDAGVSWTLLDPLAGAGTTQWLDKVAVTGGAAIVSSSRDPGVLLRVDAEGNVTSLAGDGLPGGFLMADLLAVEGGVLATVVGHAGVFVSTDLGLSWQALGDELGDARAMAVRDGRLRIGVHGEGLASAPLACE